MSSSATQSATGPVYSQFGDLYVFPSFDNVYSTVKDFEGHDGKGYIWHRLRPTCFEKSAIYITCKLEDPRSFVWVSRHDETDTVSSGTCYYLDIDESAVSADQTGVGLQADFTDRSIMEGFKRHDNLVEYQDSNWSSEMNQLWQSIKEGRQGVATEIECQMKEISLAQSSASADDLCEASSESLVVPTE